MRRRTYRKRPQTVADIRRLKFGELTALRLAGRSPRRVAKWFCRCSCGTTVIVEGDRLRRGTRLACGKNGHYAKRKTLAPGLRRFKAELATWYMLKTRCFNKRSAHYRNYGRAGITLDPKWLASFEQFLMDVGKRPSPRHVLRRLDNTGNYVPGNVEWRIEGGT